MLFNSYIFLLAFLPVSLAGFFFLGSLGKFRAAACWLTLASFFFYAWWNPPYLILLLASIVVNYWTGIGIHEARKRRIKASPLALLTIGVILNLGTLAYFKYANFFTENARHLLGIQFYTADILLPLAISFFTFTQIAYLVDAYHGVTEEHDFLWYAFFVSFFPHLIAGPIVSYRRLMPQFALPETYRFQTENMAAGLSLFTIGLAKKTLIADNLAPMSQAIFDNPASVPPLVPAWIGALAYTFQLYFDFSAYSDMAIGLARMFNVRFPLNFNSPYKANDISDFWRRWHMTLSHFLRDHLYIPLGGNRHGEPRRLVNLMLTMLLGGLWHGAAWTFVVWGALHGFYLVIHHTWQRLTQDFKWTKGAGIAWAARILTLLAVIIGWVFFRAHSLSQALVILQGMAGLHGPGLPDQFAPVLGHLGVHASSAFAALPSQIHIQLQLPFLIFAAAIAFFAPNTDEIFRIAQRYTDQSRSAVQTRIWKLSSVWAVGTACLLAASFLNLAKLREFIYFKF